MSAEYDRLILFVAMGDMRALELLYDALYPNVFSLALSVTGSRSAAEDLAQDTFIRVFTYAKNYQERGYGRAWVLRITRNLALNYVKQQKTVPFEKITLPGDDDPDLENVDDRSLLEILLGKLSASQREVVTLRSKGYSYAEIARVTTAKEPTVRWQYNAALKNLRELVKTSPAFSDTTL